MRNKTVLNTHETQRGVYPILSSPQSRIPEPKTTSVIAKIPDNPRGVQAREPLDTTPYFPHRTGTPARRVVTLRARK